MLFFPSHDIALGNGVRHFNPPAAAMSLQQDLSWLAEVWNQGQNTPLPWGWDWDTREHLARNLGIKRDNLPTDNDLELLRQLSSRRTTITILNDLRYDGPMPEYITTDNGLMEYIRRMDDEGRAFVLKSPWSSSGRGLVRSQVTPRPLMMQRASAIIRKMGGIMGETWLCKSQDFAMLFFVGNEGTQFVGYSLFDNEESGTYRQGYLMSNEAMERRITEVMTKGSADDLHLLRDRLIGVLNRLFAPFFGLGWKVGYIGIDMMTVTGADAPKGGIMPCVELNLRCTMGVVSRLWADRNMKPQETGIFRISPMKDNGHFEAQFIID